MADPFMPEQPDIFQEALKTSGPRGLPLGDPGTAPTRDQMLAPRGTSGMAGMTAAGGGDLTGQIEQALLRQLKLSRNPLFVMGESMTGRDPAAGLSPLVSYLHQKGQMGLQERQVKATEEHVAAQNALIRQQVLKGTMDLAGYLGTLNLPEEARTNVAKFLSAGVAMGKPEMAGQLDVDAMIRDVLSGEMTPAGYEEILKDLTPAQVKEFQRHQQLDREKGTNNALAYVKAIGEQLDKTAQERLIARLTTMPKDAMKPPTVADVSEVLALDPRSQRLLGAMKPEELQKYGIMAKSQAIMQAEARAQAVGRLSPGDIFIRYAQELYPGRDPNSLTADETAAVNQKVKAEKGEVAALTGAGTVTATAAAKRDLKLWQTMSENERVVDTRTKEAVDPFTITGKEIEEAPKGSYARMNHQQFQQFQGFKEARIILKIYREIADQLTKTPGATFAQAAGFFAKTKLGIENPGVDLDAMMGSRLRLGGTFQGSRVQLSDQDVKSIVGALPTSMDSAQVAHRRLNVVDRLVSIMEDTALGIGSGAALRHGIEALPKPPTVTITGPPRRIK